MNKTDNKKFELIHILFLFIIILTAYLIYLPGTAGDFLFDDFSNLSTLGDHGTIDSLEKANKFIFSGFSGPTGRPVSLTTFLLNDNTWPSDNAASFKYTNILFHLANGLLLYWIIILINQKILHNQNSMLSMWIALLTSAVWLLHPYLVSTVLYIIQRMTILMTFFALISIIFYLKGRIIADRHHNLSLTLVLISYFIFIPLSVFSKENGALIPLLILLIEIFFFNKSRINNRNLRLTFNFLVYGAAVCTTILLLYYLKIVIFNNSGYSSRDFTLSERILTESRILFIYIYNWFIPHIQTAGLYNDGIEISKNLFTPITTLVSIITHLFIIVICVIKKNKYPLISFSILFFYTAHLMESTFIPLELVFEHRNYLAALFLFYPISYYLVTKFKSKLKYLVTSGIFIVLVTILILRINIWKDTNQAKFIWANQAPYSLRAQLDNARYYFFKGQLNKSIYHIRQAIKNHPDNPKPYIFNEFIYCINRGVQPSQERIDIIKQSISRTAFHISLYEYLNYLVTLTETKNCSNINFKQIIEIIDFSINSYPLLSKSLQNMLIELKGTAFLYDQKPDKALATYINTLKSTGNINSAMSNIAKLASRGYYDEALLLLNLTESKVKHIYFSNQGDINYKEEITHLRNTLQEDIKHDRNRN